MLKSRMCPVCAVVKPIAEYGATGRGRKRRYCKSCSRKTKSRRLSRNSRSPAQRQKARDEHLQRVYGIGLTAFEAMLDAQGGRCANPGCRTDDPGKQWHVDHDHITGKVRGVLCPSCNSSLGLLGENRDRIAGLITYLDITGS